MSKTTTTPTSRASLCALGEYLRRHCFFAPLREQVTIPQKTVKYCPIDKILDGLLGILCAAKTISQSNGTIRLDPAVHRAFGRTGCAEQSTIARRFPRSEILQQSGMRLRSFCPEHRMTCDCQVDR